MTLEVKFAQAVLRMHLTFRSSFCPSLPRPHLKFLRWVSCMCPALQPFHTQYCLFLEQTPAWRSPSTLALSLVDGGCRSVGGGLQ